MKNLTNTKTPKELHAWMDKNLTYHGVNKGRVLTAKEVVSLKKAHCWETSDLAIHELKSMGFKTKLVYMETKNVTVTHTTVLYQGNEEWFWFEWAWGKHAGISKPYATLAEILEKLTSTFKAEYKSIMSAYYGNLVVTEGMTEEQYMDKLRTQLTEINLNNKITAAEGSRLTDW